MFQVILIFIIKPHRTFDFKCPRHRDWLPTVQDCRTLRFYYGVDDLLDKRQQHLSQIKKLLMSWTNFIHFARAKEMLNQITLTMLFLTLFQKI